MKHLFDFTKTAAAVLIAAVLLTGVYKAADETAVRSVLNVSEITYGQVGLCLVKPLDGFESDETVRMPLYDNALYTGGSEGAFSCFEGSSLLMLSGTETVGAELSFLKHPSLSGCRSIAVSVFIKPDAGASVFNMTLTATGTDATVTASGEVPAGSWQTAFMPVSFSDPGQLVSVKAVISSDGGEIEAALDFLHTSTAAGMPEDLRLFAADFSCRGGKLSYADDGSLVFSANGKDGYIESSVCNYLLPEKYNTLAVTVDNAAGASSAVLSCRINGASKFTDDTSYTHQLAEGKSKYYFKIGFFRGENVLNDFRLSFPGRLKGEIKIEKIELTSYRYPASYPGTLSVTASGDVLTVSGSVPSYPAGSSEIRLYRLFPSEDEERFEELDVTPYRTAEPSKTFSFVLPKTDGGEDNSLYKYFAVFCGSTSYYAAPAAYVPFDPPEYGTVGCRSVSLQSDLSVVSLAEPDTVFLTFDTEKLFCEDGEYNEEYLTDFDAAALRLGLEGFGAAAVLSFPSGLPDLRTEASLSSFSRVMKLISERYGDVIKAVIPCGDLNGAQAAESAGSEDRAVRYAAALARTSSYLLSEKGIKVLLPLCSDADGGFDTVRFLQMLGEENTEAFGFGFILNAPGGKTVSFSKVSSFLSSSLLYKGGRRELICGLPFPKTEKELITAFYSATEYSDGAYFYGAFYDDEVTALFKAADSSDGVGRADEIMRQDESFYLTLLYPHAAGYKKICRKTEISASAPEGSVSILFDGRIDGNWIACDVCHDIYQGAVNNDPAAELAFDFSLGSRGRAFFSTEAVQDNGAIYARLYADYLPADARSAEVEITVYGDNGCVYGVCALHESEISAVRIPTDGLLGTVRRISFFVRQNESETLSTPRICVLGVYSTDAASEETVTEVRETETPKPDTQIFVTETEAQTEPAVPEEGGTGRLLLITLGVMLFMFFACGAVIFTLKKISEKSNKEQK